MCLLASGGEKETLRLPSTPPGPSCFPSPPELTNIEMQVCVQIKYKIYVCLETGGGGWGEKHFRQSSQTWRLISAFIASNTNQTLQKGKRALNTN